MRKIGGPVTHSMLHKFVQPDLYCPKCHNKLPVAGDAIWRSGRWVILSTDQLVCEPCARAAMPPKKRVFRRRKGEHSEDQDTILTPECPTIIL
jgi:hypothetical protein